MKTLSHKSSATAEILLALRARGQTASSWARVHGHNRSTVLRVIYRWAGRTDRAPHGGLARQIIAALRAEIGVDLLPEPVGAALAALDPSAGKPAPTTHNHHRS